MRIILVWLLVIMFLFTVTVCYFFVTPVFIMLMDLLDSLKSVIGLSGMGLSAFENMSAVYRYSWGVVFIIFILVIFTWAYLHSQKRDQETAVTGMGEAG